MTSIASSTTWQGSVSSPDTGLASQNILITSELVYVAVSVDANASDAYWTGMDCTINGVSGSEVARINPGANTQGLVVFRWHDYLGNGPDQGTQAVLVDAGTAPSATRNTCAALVQIAYPNLYPGDPDQNPGSSSGSQSSISITGLASHAYGFGLGFCVVNTYTTAGDVTSASPQSRVANQEHVGAGGILVVDEISQANIDSPTETFGWTISTAERTAAIAMVLYPGGPNITDFGDENHQWGETGLVLTGSGFGT